MRKTNKSEIKANIEENEIFKKLNLELNEKNIIYYRKLRKKFFEGDMAIEKLDEFIQKLKKRNSTLKKGTLILTNPHVDQHGSRIGVIQGFGGDELFPNDYQIKFDGYTENEPYDRGEFTVITKKYLKSKINYYAKLMKRVK